MSRTNHAKHEYEARAAREAQEYRQRIAARDARRECREQVREFARGIDWLSYLPLALATFS